MADELKDRQQCLGKLNDQLKAGTEFSYDLYHAVMPDYMFHSKTFKWKFWNNNLNIGYKFHLNVLPKDIRTVSDFLKEHDYEHKYLSGGEVEDGKIFTVYAGSKQQTELIIKEIADASLINVLQPFPHDNGEAPFAPNILGRFCGQKYSNREPLFHQYGMHGISFLNSAYYDVVGDPKNKWHNPEWLKQQFTKADKVARDLYGEYYGGGITFYQPQAKK
jgi:hypothetical protein